MKFQIEADNLKFPMKDELIAKLDKRGRPLMPIPSPKGFIGLPDDIVADAISVWEFLNVFNRQLSLPSIEISSFFDLMTYTKVN